MARLPQPGGDNGNWGTILNDYLSQSHKADGTLKSISQANVTNLQSDINAKTTWVNVLEYGADPTGTTFSDIAVDNAINSAPDRSASIFFPAGHYKFANSILVGNSTKIRGAGGLMSSQTNGIGGGPAVINYQPQTVLDFPNVTDGIVTPNSTAYNFRAHGIEISHLTLKGSGTGNATSGIWFRKNVLNEAANKIYGKVGLSSINHCYIEGFGTGVNGDATCDSCSVLNTHIHDCGVGIIDGDSEMQVIRSCIWKLSVGPAIQATGSRGYYAFNEIEPGFTHDGIKITLGKDNKVIGNDIKDCATGIVLWGERNSITGNSFSRNIYNHAVLIGRSTGEYSATDCVVTGNTIAGFGVDEANGVDGIRIFPGADRAIVSSNTFSSPGTFASTSIYAAAIHIGSSTAPHQPTGYIISGNSANGLIKPWFDESEMGAWNNSTPTAPYEDFTFEESRRLTTGQETLPRTQVTSNTQTGNQLLRLTYFKSRKSETVSQVRVASGSTAAGTTPAGPSLIRIGLYRVDVSGALTLIAATANDPSVFAAATTSYTQAFTVPVAIQKGSWYAIGVLVVTTGTAPTMAGHSNVLPATEYGDSPKLGGLVSGQTNLPSSLAAASVGQAGQLAYAAILP